MALRRLGALAVHCDIVGHRPEANERHIYYNSCGVRTLSAVAVGGGTATADSRASRGKLFGRAEGINSPHPYPLPKGERDLKYVRVSAAMQRQSPSPCDFSTKSKGLL